VKRKSFFRRLDPAIVLGLPAAVAVVLLAQRLEGAPLRALWQPTAALVVFGGSLAAVVVSYPFELVRRTVLAVRDTCVSQSEPIEPVLAQLLGYSQIARRKGLVALEAEIERASSPFLKTALGLAVDGTTAKVARQMLEAESDARRDSAEAPADVLETAAGYSPTLGILGAVLGLIHVMQSLSDPSKLGSGIAVAFVATVYGVGAANLVLLPLATRIRGLARRDAISREVIIEGMSAVQEGLNPRLLEQKLRGFLAASAQADAPKKVA
jgi:chemotaxis protein MotA